MTNKNKFTRRDFLATTATAAAGFTIVPSNAIAGLGHKAPSDKLNIAGIGVGGMGKGNLQRMAGENIVALCDVDWTTGGRMLRFATLTGLPVEELMCQRFLKLIQKLQSIMIGVKCSMKWGLQLMRLCVQLPTIHMPLLRLMPLRWENMPILKNH